ncbi:MAG: hypothetical protein M3362_10100 [Acidobacteriota bacterium]|nr:hypothetical protein [Acidobacteriota bacterium]
MATLTQRIRITNDRAAFATLWLEPWGEDYGMSPGDEFEIVAADADEGFYFHVVNEEKGVKVYAEGDVSQISVCQGGEVLSCGHNRRDETW